MTWFLIGVVVALVIDETLHELRVRRARKRLHRLFIELYKRKG